MCCKPCSRLRLKLDLISRFCMDQIPTWERICKLCLIPFLQKRMDRWKDSTGTASYPQSPNLATIPIEIDSLSTSGNCIVPSHMFGNSVVDTRQEALLWMIVMMWRHIIWKCWAKFFLLPWKKKSNWSRCRGIDSGYFELPSPKKWKRLLPQGRKIACGSIFGYRSRHG